VMKTIEGPIVLVAHSYGGAVSSLAANGVGNVKALVYLNALAMDAGESNLGIIERFPNEFVKALLARPFPQGVDLYVDPTKFRALFAPDVPARTAARMASAQRPLSAAATEEKVTEPAWKTLPSWYLIGRQDEVISPVAQRFMAKRAKAQTVEINSSHASYVSHPDEVTKLILRAARSVGRA
jgi:pimeloyl-ACP methyl ester carboxylesterase